MAEFKNQALPTFRTGDVTTRVKGIHRGTISINPASIAADTTGVTTLTILGVAVGDEVLFFTPVSLEIGLAFSGSRVSGADEVKHRLSNITESAVDAADRVWSYIWFDLT